MNDQVKYVKFVGADGFDTVYANGEVVFVGPSLAVSAWISKNDIFISDVRA